MNFDHEELTLMMLYNTGTRLGLIHELRLMQCYLMPDEKVFCSSKRYAIINQTKFLSSSDFSAIFLWLCSYQK